MKEGEKGNEEGKEEEGHRTARHQKPKMGAIVGIGKGRRAKGKGKPKSKRKKKATKVAKKKKKGSEKEERDEESPKRKKDKVRKRTEGPREGDRDEDGTSWLRRDIRAREEVLAWLNARTMKEPWETNPNVVLLMDSVRGVASIRATMNETLATQRARKQRKNREAIVAEKEKQRRAVAERKMREEDLRRRTARHEKLTEEARRDKDKDKKKEEDKRRNREKEQRKREIAFKNMMRDNPTQAEYMSVSEEESGGEKESKKETPQRSGWKEEWAVKSTGNKPGARKKKDTRANEKRDTGKERRRSRSHSRSRSRRRGHRDRHRRKRRQRDSDLSDESDRTSEGESSDGSRRRSTSRERSRRRKRRETVSWYLENKRDRLGKWAIKAVLEAGLPNAYGMTEVIQEEGRHYTTRNQGKVRHFPVHRTQLQVLAFVAQIAVQKELLKSACVTARAVSKNEAKKAGAKEEQWREVVQPYDEPLEESDKILEDVVQTLGKIVGMAMMPKEKVEASNIAFRYAQARLVTAGVKGQRMNELLEEEGYSKPVTSAALTNKRSWWEKQTASRKDAEIRRKRENRAVKDAHATTNNAKKGRENRNKGGGNENSNNGKKKCPNGLGCYFPKCWSGHPPGWTPALARKKFKEVKGREWEENKRN